MKRELLSKQQLEQLCKEWDIFPEEVECTGRGFQLRTRWGERFLCLCPTDEAVFGWYLRQHLFGRGFSRLLRYIPNKYGDPYVLYEEKAAFLTDWLPTARWQLKGDYDVALLAGILADFHLNGDGFFIPGAVLERLVAPDEQLEQTLSFEPPPLSAQNVEAFDRLQKRCANLLKALPKKTISQLSKEAMQEGQAVHGWFSSAAVRETFGSPILVDFSQSSYGVRVWDFAIFVSNCLMELGFARELIKTAVAAYEQKRRFSENEREVFMAAVDIPFGFVAALNKWEKRQIDSYQFNILLLREDEYWRQRAYDGQRL